MALRKAPGYSWSDPKRPQCSRGFAELFSDTYAVGLNAGGQIRNGEELSSCTLCLKPFRPEPVWYGKC